MSASRASEARRRPRCRSDETIALFFVCDSKPEDRPTMPGRWSRGSSLPCSFWRSGAPHLCNRHLDICCLLPSSAIDDQLQVSWTNWARAQDAFVGDVSLTKCESKAGGFQCSVSAHQIVSSP